MTNDQLPINQRVVIIARTNPDEYGLPGTLREIKPEDELGECYWVHLDGCPEHLLTAYAPDEVMAMADFIDMTKDEVA